MNVVGLSFGYHDSACCLLRDGELVAAVQEERFSRVKNDKSVPRSAFRYCLEQGGISIADIDCVAYYEDATLKTSRQVWMGLSREAPRERCDIVMQSLMRMQPSETIRRALGYEGEIDTVDHHASHAASSYYFSGFEDAAVLTIDGVGDWPTTSYSRARGDHIERFETVDFPHSLGLFYSAVTGYLGFEVNEGEYKVMGLAPYGRPTFAAALRRLIEPGPAGQYRLNMEYFAFLQESRMYSQRFIELLGRAPRAPESQLEQFHMDVARSAQYVLEEILLEKVRYLHSEARSENLCMAGGVALNVVANARCLREGPFKRLFVQPAAGDAGGALGAAAVAWVRRQGCRPMHAPMRSAYLGPGNSSDDVCRLLADTSAVYEDYRGREPDLLRYTAGRLREGKVVAWCHGRCEFGPRALGARSILADPRVPDMRDRINALIKQRESFRPFAPSVLEEEQSAHFALQHLSPFMLETCQVASSIDMPAITHVDGSARVHTVSHDTNPRFAALLREFFRVTGCPVLLNTSFNMRGEPIVLTAVDAILCFVRSGLDVLVIEDCVLERAGIPAVWQLMASRAASARSSAAGHVGHLVYTFF